MVVALGPELAPVGLRGSRLLAGVEAGECVRRNYGLFKRRFSENFSAGFDDRFAVETMVLVDLAWATALRVLADGKRLLANAKGGTDVVEKTRFAVVNRDARNASARDHRELEVHIAALFCGHDVQVRVEAETLFQHGIAVLVRLDS